MNAFALVLWVAQVDNVGAIVKLAQVTGPGGYKYIGELNAASFANRDTASEDGQTPTQHIQALINAAKDLRNDTKKKPQPNAGNPLPALKARQDGIAPTVAPADQMVIIPGTTALEDKVIADILHNACKALNAGCFAAGTKLLTKTGWRAVETIQRGEEVASRHELEPNGDVAWKVVEDTFQRTGCILHVHVGGQVIRTTPEHLFWVDGQGWLAAGALRAGDRIATLSREWVTISEVFDTEQWEPVYNLRVAEYHTYFVGDERWSFSVWAHNDYTVRHLPAGNTNANSIGSVGQWNIFSKEPAGGGGKRPDRDVRLPDGSGVFQFKTKADADRIASHQNSYEDKAMHPTNADGRFELDARANIRGETRFAEILVRLDVTGSDEMVGGEIDFESATNSYECGVSFAGKLDQLIKLCVIARLRGKTLIGISSTATQEASPNRFTGYQNSLEQLTFSSYEVQQYLNQLTTNPSRFSDNRPLSDFFGGFQFISQR